PRKELEEMCTEKPDEPLELVCHYCGSVYKYDKKELLSLLK
ncbi:MAG: Hsp33 family molecular chaperone HslO, partial [Spirochaetaceae bacterium]|nr:Hsp33 family molecular chaperone HslO [Spirochaetaceae bacterium]